MPNPSNSDLVGEAMQDWADERALFVEAQGILIRENEDLAQQLEQAEQERDIAVKLLPSYEWSKFKRKVAALTTPDSPPDPPPNDLGSDRVDEPLGADARREGADPGVR